MAAALDHEKRAFRRRFGDLVILLRDPLGLQDRIAAVPGNHPHLPEGQGWIGGQGDVRLARQTHLGPLQGQPERSAQLGLRKVVFLGEGFVVLGMQAQRVLVWSVDRAGLAPFGTDHDFIDPLLGDVGPRKLASGHSSEEVLHEVLDALPEDRGVFLHLVNYTPNGKGIN